MERIEGYLTNLFLSITNNITSLKNKLILTYNQMEYNWYIILAPIWIAIIILLGIHIYFS